MSVDISTEVLLVFTGKALELRGHPSVLNGLRVNLVEKSLRHTGYGNLLAVYPVNRLVTKNNQPTQITLPAGTRIAIFGREIVISRPGEMPEIEQAVLWSTDLMNMAVALSFCHVEYSVLFTRATRFFWNRIELAHTLRISLFGAE